VLKTLEANSIIVTEFELGRGKNYQAGWAWAHPDIPVGSKGIELIVSRVPRSSFVHVCMQSRKPSQGRSEGNARDLEIWSVSLRSMLPRDADVP
jgi:hypothetical protein